MIRSNWLPPFRVFGVLGWFLLATGLSGCEKSANRVVLYSAQDQDFAERVLAGFQSHHAWTVVTKFDTEANKSVGIVMELQQEKDHPRCDVHWNNEILGTIRLARQGIYEPYASPVAAGFPPETKTPHFQAFAERARVLIVNTDRVPEADRPTSIFAMIDPRWKGQIALAKPNFGTTATHAACLFDTLGTDAAQDYFRKLQANNVQLVAGNKQVARSVAEGRSAFGLTDTDDAILELLAGKPVTLVYPDAAGHLEFPKLGTLFIPNTLALVRGGPNPEAGKKLIDYLLSPAVETQLAQGGGYQLPVNPELKGIVHPALKTRHQVKAMAPDWEKAADIWEDVQSFLRNEFMRSSGN